MEKCDIEDLREKVSCEAVLQSAGWSVDEKESTRRALKYRRGEGEIVIVIHDGKGWFDPLSDAKGDVFSLVSHLGGYGFSEALDAVSGLVGFVPAVKAWKRPARPKTTQTLPDRWQSRPSPRPGSPAWRYLVDERAIPAFVLRAVILQDLLREGPWGSMWAAHADEAGNVIGWEERGPEWRGFSTGGSKMLFRLGLCDAPRICITEAAIDAISLAAIENLRRDTLYVSTGGGWAPATSSAVGAHAMRTDVQLVAATDRNRQGHAYAERIREISATGTCSFRRIEPRTEDWNADLQAAARAAEGTGTGEGKTEETEMRRQTGAACPSAASREASPGKCRPLTRRTGEAAVGGGDEKA
ncbi:DUF3991 domain-containing protein [Mesorhizobium sp. A556]